MTPAPVVVPQLWRLGADPTRLIRAAQAWRDLAGRTATLRTDVARSASTLLAHWRGPTAEAYAAHRAGQDHGLATLSTVAGQLAAMTEETARVLAAAQDHLDDSWRRVRRAVTASARGDEVIFRPADGAGAARVAAAVSQAQEIRAHAEARLAQLAVRVDQVRQRVWIDNLVASMTEAGPNPLRLVPWLTGPDAPGTAGLVLLDGDRAIVNAGAGDDDIRFAVDPLTQERLVTLGGITRRLPPGTEVVIRAGAGDDTVTVAPGTRVRVTALGGAGGDTLIGADGSERLFGLWGTDTLVAGGGADRLSAGVGRDYVDGGAGDDVLDGGAGTDTLYGGDGADVLWGGDDQDYLDGGSGDDLAHGMGGRDAVLGGRGADTLLGGAGDDRLYGGAGADRLAGGPGVDVAFAQPVDAVDGETTVTVEIGDTTAAIRVEGSAEFVARVRSDLDALASSPVGAAMLDGIDHSGHVVTIREIPGFGEAGYDRDLGGRNAIVGYNPRFDDFWYSPPVPPVVVLYHELAHAYDFTNGTLAEGIYTGADNPLVPNLERVAVGLPIDDDGDGDTPAQLDPRHPYALTENGLRSELNLTPRTRY
jgi:hypothetical protein